MLKQLKSHKYFTWECAERDRWINYNGHFLHSHSASGPHHEETEEKYGFGREVILCD